MLSTLTSLSLAASGGTLAADDGVLASHRGGDHRGGGFFFLLLLLALVGGGLSLWRRRRGDATVDPTPPPAPPIPPVDGARALLDERFAKGEIDQAEYEHRRAVLAGESAPVVTAPQPPAAPEVPGDEPEADESK